MVANLAFTAPRRVAGRIGRSLAKERSPSPILACARAPGSAGAGPTSSQLTWLHGAARCSR
eukprot:5069538-Lingulodinium_polyedra.AAC.1